MTTTITLLADGITPFTSPADLHNLYGRLWDAGIPINIGVIPAVRGTTSIDADGKHPLPAIPKDKRDTSQPYRISENEALCNYLNAMRQQRLVEICMQGYHASYDEFATDDDVLLGQKIEEGLADLQKAMPDAASETIIAPEKTVSATAMQLLSQYDCHLCVPIANKTDNEPKILANERKQYHYGAPIISLDTLSDSPSRLQAQIQSGTFIVVRFPVWMARLENQPIIDAWQKVVEIILGEDDVYIDTLMYIE
ncbi:MAG: DUF2334 domain-containing protein [Chloroflexota bacterium]